jgi:hypothetical protein
MSYSLGQAKLVPGQIHFQTTPTGRIRTVQPLLEAGLPIAPYIEHGSWATGMPAIMRYGRDPYRGISGVTARDETGWSTTVPLRPLGQDPADEAGAAVSEAIAETIRHSLGPAVLIGSGVAVGAAAGVAGALLRRPILSGLLGAAGGGFLGFLAWKNLATIQTTTAGSGALSGVLAVL